MKRDIRTDPAAGRYCRCYDAATGKEIKGVVWADDEAGEYGAYKTNENGDTTLVNGELVLETLRRPIRLVDERLPGAGRAPL